MQPPVGGHVDRLDRGLGAGEEGVGQGPGAAGEIAGRGGEGEHRAIVIGVDVAVEQPGATP